MLVTCPTCQHAMSSEATACPSCGHPTASKVAASASNTSHGSGWISLAAVLLASFTPAILAPIFVLVGLIFATKELNSGGKAFGMLVLCLSLLQGWFVVDHFGHVSGTLGITTAKEIDVTTAAQYADTNTAPPAGWRPTAQAKCSQDWPTDYQMQKYCLDQQEHGVQELSTGAPAGVDQGAFRIIRGKCSEEWPQDFQMRAHCEKQQYEGYFALNRSTQDDSVRNVCAQQWPNDYQMRRYCETHGR